MFNNKEISPNFNLFPIILDRKYEIKSKMKAFKKGNFLKSISFCITLMDKPKKMNKEMSPDTL